MPKGKWTPPEAGDAPQEVKDILEKAYSAYRDEHPAENEATKTAGAKIAWGAVHNAGWSKNSEGKWTKSKKEMSEAKRLESLLSFIEKQTDTNPDTGKEKYGDVKFADAKNKKYPIDTEEHIRAAWNYINKEKNAGEYSAEDVKTIKSHIVAAWKEKIDKEGPPAAKEMSEEIVIDAFKAGDYPQGKFGKKELSEIASTYNPENYEAPILIGHLSDPSYKGKSSIPAFGWIGKVKVVGDHLKLVASQFSDELKDYIKKGFYKKVSAAFYDPTDATNPTPGKWHLHHLAFLGGTPPAVKGLEGIQFSSAGLPVEMQEMDTEVEVDGTAIDTVEEVGTDDTLSDLQECCATFLSKVEEALTNDIDAGTQKSRCQLAAYDLQNELTSIMNMHWMFIDKLENVEEHQENEYQELKGKKKWLVQFKELFTKRKESDVDAKKEQQYQADIAALKAKVTAFEEEKQRAETARLEAEKTAKENATKAEIATFCEAQIKGGKMTPAMREKDEPIMLKLAVDPDALKAFQEKYTVGVVPTGEVDMNGKVTPEVKTKLQKAEEYVKSHPAEFKEMNLQESISRAVFLDAKGDIKL